jgi:hypothetical protein
MNSSHSHQPQQATCFETMSELTDHDQPYRFGRRPRAMAPYPFSTRQFARLLVLRSRLQAGQFAGDDLAAA